MADEKAKKPLTPEQRQARRDAMQRMYRRRKGAGLCVRCGKERDAKARKAEWADCSVCRGKMREASEASRRRGRQKTWRGMGTAGDPMPTGRAAPRTGAVKQVTVSIDQETWDALHAILRRDGNGPYRVARLVRDAIRRWETRPCPPRKKRGMMLPGVRIRVWLDARQLAVVRGQVGRHGGSVAEVVRAMIVADRPKVIASVGGGRRPYVDVFKGW